MIETAFVLPIIVTMLLGVANFGVLLQEYMRVCDSARAGAQTGMVRIYATDASSIQTVASYSALGIPGFNTVVTNYCTCANGAGTVSCSSHSNCGAYGIPNQYVKVTATATLPLLFKMAGFPASYQVQSVAITRTAWTGTN